MKDYNTSRVGLVLLALIFLVGWPTALRAAWYIDSSIAAKHSGGPSRLGPYATRAEAEAVIARTPGYGLRLIPGGYDEGSGGSSVTGSPSTSDPRLPLPLELGWLIGQELHKLLFGNPEEEARQRQQVQAEALGLKQLAEARRAEEERAKQELYERLSQTLKVSGLGELAPKGFDEEGSGLTPKDLNSSSQLEMKLDDSYELASAALAAELAEKRSTPPAQDGSGGTAPATGAAGGGTALDQAYTSNKETRQGLDSGKLESMKEQSNKVFDNPVPLQSSGINPAVDLRNVGKAPEWPAFVRNDKEIIQMQRDRDALLATQQKKDAELMEIRKQIEAKTDSEEKGDLMVKAAQLKAESSQAEYEAALKDKEIQKRAKLLIDTQVKETPPASKDKITP